MGSVFQNPKSQIFNPIVKDELAFKSENYKVAPKDILNKVEEVLADHHMSQFRNKNLFHLSGAQRQKISCLSISVYSSNIIVLDEPSSNLDINSITELSNIIKNWKNEGKTIVIGEHRLYYLMDIADRVLYMKNGRIESDFAINEFLKLSEKELHQKGLRSIRPISFTDMDGNSYDNTSHEEVSIFNFSNCFDKKIFLDIPNLKIKKGAIVGVLGNNGAGKSTFAKCMCGILKKSKGRLQIGNENYNGKRRLKKCFMVMQDVNHQLFTESIKDEILLSMENRELYQSKEAQNIINQLNLAEFIDYHPTSLSGGQKQRVAIATALISDREILIFDEPTRGLDYYHMMEVSRCLKKLSKLGKTIFIITHDPELIKECCNYFIFMEKGRLKWSGSWSNSTKEKIENFFNTQRKKGCLLLCGDVVQESL